MSVRTVRLSTKVLVLLLYIGVSSSAPIQLSAQALSSDPNHPVVSPTKLHSYLREPGGIDRLSSEVGDITISENDERWGDHSLASLARSSDLVVFGKIEGRTSRLTSDGNSIDTSYHLTPIDVLKNVTPGEVLKDREGQQVDFVVKGGTVQLSNGHTFMLHTPLSDGLQDQGTYIVFLHRDGSVLTLVSESQGILDVDQAAGVVSPVTRWKDRSAIRSELDGASISSIMDKLRHPSSEN